MISFLSGIVEGIGENTAVIDVGGVGFEVFLPADTLSRLPSVGESVRLYTYFSVTQDAMRLYGFLSRDDLEIFKKLITVSGLGPKGGQAILSVMTPEELKFAIATGDTRSITAAPGVGKKLAERIVLELKDRFKDESFDAGSLTDGALAGAAMSADDPGKEVVEALVALGYSSQDAIRAVRAAAGDLTGDLAKDTEALLKAALKEMI